MAELSGRLSAVEDQVVMLARHASVARDNAMAEGVSRLEERIRRLRDALDALRARR
jgi:hypothetical protein